MQDMKKDELFSIRCKCNRLIGKLDGVLETKCPRCKRIVRFEVKTAESTLMNVIEESDGKFKVA